MNRRFSEKFGSQWIKVKFYKEKPDFLHAVDSPLVERKVERLKDVKFCRFLLGEEYQGFESQEGKTRWGLLKKNYNVDLLPTLVMFNAGKELDRMRGRPEKEIVESYNRFLKQWIVTNLISPQENPYRFEGTLLLRKKQSSP